MKSRNVIVASSLSLQSSLAIFVQYIEPLLKTTGYAIKRWNN